MMSLAGRPIHRNGTAPDSAANYARVEFGAQVKHILIQNTGANPLQVSFDNGRTYFEIPVISASSTGILSGHWFLGHVIVQGNGGATDYQIIATQMT